MNVVTVEYADAYFQNRLYSDLWTGESVTQPTKTSALAMATSIIEGGFSFPAGTFTTNETTGETSCNDRIKKAICEQALWCLKYDQSSYPSILTKGFIEAETGVNTSITLNKEYVVPLICRTAIALIGELGDLNDIHGKYRGRLITG